MDEEKKFSLPEIIVLLMIAVANDLLLLAVDFVFALPIVGQILGAGMEFVNLIIWGIILLWFTMKLGFRGRIGVLQVAGGIAEFFGIPGRTATVLLGIILTNNPKLSKVATVAAGAALTGGVSAAAEGVAAKTAARQALRETVAAAKEERHMKMVATREPQKTGDDIPETAFGMPEETIEERERYLFEEVVREEKPKEEDVAPKKPKRKGPVPMAEIGEPIKETAEPKQEQKENLGGAYAEDVKIKKTLEEVEVDEKTNTVDLRKNAS